MSSNVAGKIFVTQIFFKTICYSVLCRCWGSNTSTSSVLKKKLYSLILRIQTHTNTNYCWWYTFGNVNITLTFNVWIQEFVNILEASWNLIWLLVYDINALQGQNILRITYTNTFDFIEIMYCNWRMCMVHVKMFVNFRICNCASFIRAWVI